MRRESRKRLAKLINTLAKAQRLDKKWLASGQQKVQRYTDINHVSGGKLEWIKNIINSHRRNVYTIALRIDDRRLILRELHEIARRKPNVAKG